MGRESRYGTLEKTTCIISLPGTLAVQRKRESRPYGASSAGMISRWATQPMKNEGGGLPFNERPDSGSVQLTRQSSVEVQYMNDDNSASLSCWPAGLLSSIGDSSDVDNLLNGK